MRNLRKAWAAKRGKRVKRKNPAAKRKLAANGSFNTIMRLCEYRGPSFVLNSVATWCVRNADQLVSNGYTSDAATYQSLARRIASVTYYSAGT